MKPGEISQQKSGRGPGRRFVKGEVTNPRGRPPLTDAQRLARTLRAQCQPELVEALLQIVRTADDTKDRIAAAKALLEELPTEVSVTSPDGPLPTLHEVLAGMVATAKAAK